MPPVESVITLDVVWKSLADAVRQALQARLEATRDPRLFEDPQVRALDRWLFLFDREIGAVRTVHDAVEAGARLSPDDIRVAQHTGERLLEVVRPVLSEPDFSGEAAPAAQASSGSRLNGAHRRPPTTTAGVTSAQRPSS
jgi:hypothetical protein